MTMRAYQEACNPLCSLPCCTNQPCVGCQRGASQKARDSRRGSAVGWPEDMTMSRRTLSVATGTISRTATINNT